MLLMICLGISIICFGVLSFSMHEANYGAPDDEDEAREEYKHKLRITFIVFICFLVIAVSLGLSTLAFAIAAEIFPTYMVSSAIAFAASFGWFANFGVNMVFLDLLDDSEGRWYLWIILGSVAIIIMIFVIFFVPDTSGKSPRENLIEMLGEEYIETEKELIKEYDLRDPDEMDESV